ncbi:TetR/AcrR family transcriptional regulator [Bailinhaonella thermotolerans]|uniref:TetR/AcrR family transcriptional regulator n=1 Tax=Bailinhaonella thermotolerans TaxID=1070861 RepID=A0A3A4AD31_9ACTN|nr:TetR/AcrR family transcriptional regulator [Bailinhaonella thermotolerans]RJL24514.1 TetR/AcrR family transcriptional regulator [Bailinhaonella thermotolerans]
MTTGRPYRGMTAEQRSADRRERLFAAAFELFSANGFSGTTIEKLCAYAKISNRAFYECFANREELMKAVYERCMNDAYTLVSQRLKEARRVPEDLIETGVATYIGYMTEDERRAKIAHLEVRRAGLPLHDTRRAVVDEFVTLLEDNVGDLLRQRSLPDLHLLAIGLIGVIQELLIEWAMSENPPAPERLVTVATHIFRNAIAA